MTPLGAFFFALAGFGLGFGCACWACGWLASRMGGVRRVEVELEDDDEKR